MIKTCKRCGEQKDITLFYKHPRGKDGHDSKCIDCAKANSIRVRNARIEHYREYDRERGNRQGYDYVVEYRKANPKKYQAHSAVNNAVRNGTLNPLPCEICGSKKSVAHHDDYNFPLSVRWLCQAHHKQWHAKNGEGKNG